MKIENKTTVNGGISFIGLLSIALIVFKLMKVINWSWLWVLSPIWITMAFYLLIVLVPLIFFGSLYIAGKIKRKAKKKQRFKSK